MNPILLVLIIVGMVVAVFLIVRRSKSKASLAAVERMQKLIDSLVVQTVTPLGAFVLSQQQPSPERTAAIDAAFARLADVTTRNGYTQALDPAGVTIMIFPSVRDLNADGVYCPSFQVFFDPGNSYDGSMYDQEPTTPGGWTYAAEQVLDLERGVIIIADAAEPGYVTESVYNGLEHEFLYKFDRARYEATKDHSQGGGHPILS